MSGRDDSEHRRLANRAVSVSAVGLGLTGAIELAIALLTGSVGLLGDALHNLSDVGTSAMVFFGFWVSRRAPRPRYPYGFERAEDLAGLGVALFIWFSAVFAGVESYRKLVSGGGTSYVGVGVVAAAIGVAGNLAVSRYKLGIGKRIYSAALLADAHHSRLDALSSLGAMGGLLLVAAGFPIGDPIAGFAVTLFICEVGMTVSRDVLHHLLDGIEPELLEAAADIAGAAPGVSAVQRVRGRWTGRSVRLEIDLAVAPETSVEAAAALGCQIERQVRDAHEMVEEVRVIFSASVVRSKTEVSR